MCDHGNPFDRKMQSLMAIILYCVLHLGVLSASLTPAQNLQTEKSSNAGIAKGKLYTLVIIGIVVKILYHMEIG